MARSSSSSATLPPASSSELSQAQLKQVDAFLDTLFDWNTRMNLTGKLRKLARARAAAGEGRLVSATAMGRQCPLC